MESIDKTINIRVEYKDLIKGMSESAKRIDTLNDRISELKSGLKGLRAERKAGTIDEEAYNERVAQTTQELAANRAEVKALQSAMRTYSREIQGNIKEEKNLEGAVNGLRASIRNLTAEYNALSAADRAGAIGNGLAERISKIQTQVSAAEQRLGNFRSNVGNYQSAFNGLNVAVSQIVRELPSAAMGADMFFLAISDNIPMLVDEINKLREFNKSSEQSVPILKQLGAAVFSWNSLISVGITLLTVYGKDIVSWIGNLFKGREAAMTMAEAQAEVNKQMAESSGSYGDQVAQLRALQLQWNQLGDDLKAKTEFVKNNREAFDKLGVAITTVADADNLFIQNTDAFIEAMNLRAQANAANELATQKYKDALIARQKAEDKIKRGTGEIVYAGIDEYGDTSYEYRRRAYTEDEKKEILAEVEALEAEASAFTQLTVARNADAKSILDRAGIKESEKSSKSANDDPYADESGVKKAERMMEGYYARSKQELQKWVDEQREIIRKTANCGHIPLYNIITNSYKVGDKVQISFNTNKVSGEIVNLTPVFATIKKMDETIITVRQTSIDSIQNISTATEIENNFRDVDRLSSQKLLDIFDALLSKIFPILSINNRTLIPTNATIVGINDNGINITTDSGLW